MGISVYGIYILYILSHIQISNLLALSHETIIIPSDSEVLSTQTQFFTE